MPAELVSEQLRALYRTHDVSFREIEHPPTYTSEDSARARGEPLQIGGKALLMKADDLFFLFVLPADRKLDSGRVRRHLGRKKLRFATREELLEQTGLVPGSVPPFGQPLLPYPLFADTRLAANDRIAFNAGSLTLSHILAMDDYLRLAAPTLLDFTVAATE